MILFCVLKNREDKISDIFESTAIDVYEKKDHWELIRHKKLKGIYPQTPAEARNFSEHLVYDLKQIDCHILIGTSITGVPYYILDKNGIVLCEALESSVAVLNAIYEDFCTQQTKSERDKKLQPTKPSMDKPYLIDEEGNYYFDFVKSQKEQPNLTTKKVLLPFFEEVIFCTLIVKTSHMIPWLTPFAEKNHYSIKVYEENNVCILKVEHQICDEKMEDGRCKV